MPPKFAAILFMDKKTVPNDILIPEIGKLLDEGREVEMRPKGNSMLPFIRPEKDSVVLHKKNGVEVGDIVLAKTGVNYVMHRIIKVEGSALTLMGDGNIAGTERCTKDDILGTVIKIIRPGGKTVIPSKGKLWKALRPVRRYLLAFYRRVWTRICHR